METNKYQLDNFVIAVDERDNGNVLVMRDIAGLWRMEFDEKHSLYSYWVTTIESARGSKSLRMALQATITGIYMLSNMGCHDVIATNAISDVVEGMQNRIAEAVNKLRTESEDKEDEEWMKNSETLDEMQEEAEKEEADAKV